MSKKLASLKIKIDANGAQAIQELKTVEKKVQDIGKRMKAVGSAMTKYITGPLAAMAAVSVKNADTQLKAEAKLLTALKGREDAQKRLMAQASEIQSRSLFGDEEIINQQAIVAAMGRTETQIRDIIDAAVELSAATDMSLDSAVRNLAKTYSGLAGELGESIPALRTLTKEQLMNGDAVKLIKEQYKGFAESATTGTGSLVQLKNKFGDLTEKIGVILLPFLNKLVDKLSALVDWFANLSDGAQKTIVKIAGITAVIGPLLIAGSSLLAIFRYISPVLATATGALTAFFSISGAGLIASLAGIVVSLITIRNTIRRILNEDSVKARDAYKTTQDEFRQKVGTYSDAELQDIIKEETSSAEYFGNMDNPLRQDLAEHNRAMAAIAQEELDLRKENAAALEAFKKEMQETVNAATSGCGYVNSELEETNGLIGKLQTRIRELEKLVVSAGTDEEIADLNTELDEARTELARLQSLRSTVPIDAAEIVAYAPQKNRTADLLSGFASTDKGHLSETWKLWQQFNNNMAKEVNRAEQLGENIASILNGAMTSLAVGVGELLGDLVNGETIIDPVHTLLTVLGQALKDIGTALIGYAQIVEAAKAAMKTLWAAGPAGIAASIALGVGAVALGQVLMNKAAKMTKLAKGGLAYGPTIAMVGDNPGASSDPEVIAPLSKLRNYMRGQRLELVGNVAFELHGDVARAIINRENARIIALG